MKAIKLVIVILITITLSGCSTSKELSHDLNKEDENERNIYEETEEILSGSFSGSILIRFESIKEMIECKFCGFVEGEVVSITENNAFVKNVNFEIGKSAFDDRTEVIRISVGTGNDHFHIGDTYILNLAYNAEYDYYSLTQGDDSVYILNKGTVLIPERFIDKEIPSELNEFLLYIALTD